MNDLFDLFLNLKKHYFTKMMIRKGQGLNDVHYELNDSCKFIHKFIISNFL